MFYTVRNVNNLPTQNYYFAKDDLKAIETIVQMARAGTGHGEGYMYNDQELIQSDPMIPPIESNWKEVIYSEPC